jgi:hypothetical protein
MAEIKTNLEEIKKRYPEQLKELEQQLNKSKSKHKNDDLSSFEFFFYWCSIIQGNSYSFADLINGVANNTRQEPTVINNFSIKMKKQRASFYSSQINEPEEFKKMRQEDEKQKKEEQQRFNKLTEEEKNKEREDLLNQLRKNSGFVELSVPVKKKKFWE